MDINTKEEKGRTQVLLWSISEEGERVVLVDSFRPFCLAVPRGEEGLRELRASLPAGAELEGPLKYRYFSETVEAYRISFPGDGALASWVKRASRLRNVEVFEDDVRSSITYFHVRGIEPSGWVEVEVEGEVELENVDLRALRISDIRRVEGGDLPELRVMGAHLIIPSQGPTPSPKVDSIRAAAVSTPEGTDYFQGDEGEVISWLREKILEYDPDVIVWWRSNDVILPFIVQRASELGIDFSVGRERTGPHQSLFGHFSIVGRINLDAHDFVEDDPNIKLKNLQSALEWYGLMPGRFYEEFELSRALEEDPQGVRAFAEGVAEAMRSLWDRFGNYLAQVSRISSYPMDYALVASPGFRVEGYLMKGARKLSVVIPKRPKGFVPETYPGGMVLEPKPGVHENVAVLDFASMYPHIILNYNVSPDTLDPECKEGSVRDPEHGHCFSQAPDGLYKSSVGELLEARKRIKALKSKVKKGSPRWHILDAQEKAIKVMTNAIYGYSGWAGARWYRREVAESITAWGRNLLSQALKIVKQEKLNIFYGDSVTKDAKILIRSKGRIRYVPIEELFEGEPDYVDKASGKEYKFLNDVETITLDESGKLVWKKVKYVMRHKTYKKIYRIQLTNHWHLDVTEDHGIYGYVNLANRRKWLNVDSLGLTLVRPEEFGEYVKSIVIPCGTVVDGGLGTEQEEIRKWELIGYVLGDGYWGGNYPGAKYYIEISLGEDEAELVQKLLEPNKRSGYIRNYYRKDEKGTYKILSKELAKDMLPFKDANGKVIPEAMLNLNPNLIAAFLRGYFSADGTVIMRRGNPIVRITTINDRLAEMTRALLFLLGISNSVFQENNPNRFLGRSSGTYSKHIIIIDVNKFAEKVGFIQDRKNERLQTFTEGKHKRTIRKFEFDIKPITEIREIRYNDYVYDIEVEDTHRFFANWILIHNTDSLFLEFNKNIINKIIAEIEKELGFEIKVDKVYKRVLFTEVKKRYAGLTEDGKLDIVGLEAARGDWCRAARELQREVALKVLSQGDVQGAVALVHRRIRELREGKVPLRDLVIWKGISRPLKAYKARPPHVELAMRLEARGYKIKVGDQIGFVVVKGAGRLRDKVKLHYEADPEEIDREYYVRNQLVPAAARILKVFGVQENALIPKEGVASLFEF